LAASVEAVALRLGTLLRKRDTLSLGVGRNQLLLEGVATDPGNPVLRELAQRLHRHQLGAVKFSEGVAPEEMASLLETFGAESSRGGEPIGLGSEEELQRWPHIRLYPLAFDHLDIVDQPERLPEEDNSRATRLWIGLAEAALHLQPGGDQVGAGGSAMEPGEVARAINDRKRDVTYDKIIVGYLLQLGKELKLSDGAAATVLQQRLSNLLGTLKPDTLRQLLELGGDLGQRQQLIADASHAMPVAAVLELLNAAADASQQTISHSLLRIFTKLATHAESSNQTVRHGADASLRDTVRQLVAGWTLEDPTPLEYTRLLERLSRPPTTAPLPEGEAESEAPRLVQMSLEIGAYGETVWSAADEMIERGQLAELIGLLDRATGVDLTVEAFWFHLANPDHLRRLLLEDPKDFDPVERLITRMGVDATEPMLEALEFTENRSTRRRLLTRLSQLGKEIGPLVLARLPAAPWFVQRNMLALLSTMETWPPQFSPAPYAAHPDARVRREAVKMMLRQAATRDEAICTGLADDDEQIIRLALGAGLEHCPPAAVPRIMGLLHSRERDSELRALAIRTLAAISTPATRDWLIQRALTKRKLFRRQRLAAKSAESLAVLSVLATRWSGHSGAAQVLRLAAESPDSDIRAAAAGRAPAS
ncbi:MAG: hypothetical protein ACREMO_11950, partial [Gemmatimonadales bacterium]